MAIHTPLQALAPQLLHRLYLCIILLVLSLSNNLMYLGQVTGQLDCFVLMYLCFCLLQDIQTQEIIGRGTKIRGLYYMDDVSPGRVHHVRGFANDKKNKIWLWHRRLEHASFGYLRRLLPSLFSGFQESSFQCKACIQAKRHRVPYPLSLNKRHVLLN